MIKRPPELGRQHVAKVYALLIWAMGCVPCSWAKKQDVLIQVYKKVEANYHQGTKRSTIQAAAAAARTLAKYYWP